MVKLGTCGSNYNLSLSFWNQFDHLVGGYFFERQNAIALGNYLEKPVWVTFLYGTRNHKLPTHWKNPPKSHEDWVERFMGNLGKKSHGIILANEFKGDSSQVYYPNFEPENISRYISICRNISPNTRIMLSDFKPWQIRRWHQIAQLCEQLREWGTSVDDIGIQLHLKQGGKARVVTELLPHIVKTLQSTGVNVHFNEVSVWRRWNEKDNTQYWWRKIFEIAEDYDVESLTPWWLFPEYDVKKPMPSFQGMIDGYLNFEKVGHHPIFNRSDLTAYDSRCLRLERNSAELEGFYN